jgi:regulator of cell morphogenesis and NO signaling
MKHIGADSELRTMIAKFPEAIGVLYRNAIDFCCGGKDTLAFGCVKAHCEPASVIAQIQEAIQNKNEKKAGVNWAKETPENIIKHILKYYHAPLPGLLRVLDALAKNLMDSKQKDNNQVIELHKLLKALDAELMSHMAKEENILFPWIMTGSDDLSAPMQVMEHEHFLARDLINKIKVSAVSLQRADSVCQVRRSLCCQIDVLDFELRMHIHLENNILFPKALNKSDQVSDSPC